MGSNKKKGIVFVRSTSIISDSRVLKEADTALKCGYNVVILGWDRENENNVSTIKLNNGISTLKLCKIRSGYGNGLKSLPKLLLFQLWILIQLIYFNRKYSIIHSCDFDTVLPSLFISKFLLKKVIYDIFDYYIHAHNMPGKIESIVEKIEIFAINKSDAVIICNEGRYKQIEKSIPQRVEVIHNTPNLDMLKSNGKICKSKSSKLKVVYVGILQDNRLLKEITELLPSHKEIELHIGGFGIHQKFFESLGYENLYYYGQLKYDEVLQLETECDVLFATYNPKIKNHKYSAPNKIYEAMALNKPIIVCNDTGIDEIITKHKMGLAINYDAKEFYKSLLYLKDSNIRKNMGENGKKAYEEHFSWINMEVKLSNLYSEIYEVKK